MAALQPPPLQDLADVCPECGAKLIPGESCQETFENFLSLEYGDPAYGKVHFLTVTCYMIQHRRYSDSALVWVEKQLRQFLEGNLPSSKILHAMGKELNQQQRHWKVARQAGDPPLAKIPWSMTIADVAAGQQDPESYCVLVNHWARITLEEMQPQVFPPTS